MPSSRLQIEQQVDDLRLDRTSSAETASSATMIAGPAPAHARCDALPLPAGEFVRIARGHARRQTDVLEQPRDAILGFAPARDAVNKSGSAIESRPSGADRATQTGPGR